MAKASLSLLLLLSAGLFAQDNPGTIDHSRLFVPARGIPAAGSSGAPIGLLPDPDDKYVFTALGKKFLVTGGGRISAGTVSRILKDPALDGNVISGLLFAVYRNDLLLFGEVSDGESSGGFLARIDGLTLLKKWLVEIPGLNAPSPRIEGGHAYVAASHFIGKVDLEYGAYLWKHRDTSGTPELGPTSVLLFQDFAPPYVQGDNVVFPEVSPSRRNIIANRNSGHVLESPDKPRKSKEPF
jgi:hypothetical protein